MHYMQGIRSGNMNCLLFESRTAVPNTYYIRSMASARTFASDFSCIKTWSWLYNHDHRPKPFTTNFYLLGGCNPFGKMLVTQMGSISPIEGQTLKKWKPPPPRFSLHTSRPSKIGQRRLMSHDGFKRRILDDDDWLVGFKQCKNVLRHK